MSAQFAESVCTLCGERFAMNGPLHLCPGGPRLADDVLRDRGYQCPDSTAGHYPIYRSRWLCSTCGAHLGLGVWYPPDALTDGEA